MLICHDPKFVYYGPHKTGTGSLHGLLRRMGHLTSGRKKHDIEPADDLAAADYFFLITVRNPFSRAVSAYRYIQARRERWPTQAQNEMSAAVRKMTFAEFVLEADWKQPAYRLMTPQAAYLDAMPRCDLIIHTESFATDIEKLPFVPQGKIIPHVNRTKPTKWARHYDDELAAAVLNYYARDFELLGYDMKL